MSRQSQQWKPEGPFYPTFSSATNHPFSSAKKNQTCDICVSFADKNLTQSFWPHGQNFTLFLQSFQ
jgi:hypothetical protein